MIIKKISFLVVSQLAAVLCILFFSTQTCMALTVQVNWTSDVADMNLGDGVCAINLLPSPVHYCSLRAAIQTLNHSGDGTDIIILPPGTYPLTQYGQDEDSSLLGDLDIRRSITIKSLGPEYTTTTIVDGIQLDRVFHTIPASSSDIDVHMENFTITGGQVTGPGGGIYVDFNTFSKGTNLFLEGMIIKDNTTNSVTTLPTTWGTGAGLHVSSYSSVEIKRSTLSGNSNDYIGGAIYQTSLGGGVKISDSAILNNSAYTAGAIFTSRTIILDNVTVSGNIGNHPSSGSGGGIVIDYVTSVLDDISVIRHSTIVNNSGTSFGAIHLSDDVKVIMLNNIIANNSPGSCSFRSGAEIIFDKNNLTSDNSCELAGPGNLINTDPLLGPLADNGGPTLTHLPQKGSPAIDGGLSVPSQSTYHDQRDVFRPQGNFVDIGAIEVEYVEVEYEFPWAMFLPAIIK